MNCTACGVKDRAYQKVGLAYCYGMEKTAQGVIALFKQAGIKASAVSCTVGALSHAVINQASDAGNVACNPLSQARQLQADGVDLAVVFGLCLGHDILFTREFSGDQTTLLVKDRVYNHAPLLGIEQRLAVLPIC